jgi:hypothetical protein
MIDQHQALSEAIRTALAQRHRELLLNGYGSLERLSHRLDEMECSEPLKVAVGQDWSPSGGLAPPSSVEEIHDDLCEICGIGFPDMLVVSVIPGLDGHQRRQWAVTYSMRYANSMYSVSAKLSQWQEPTVRMLGWPHPLPESERPEEAGGNTVGFSEEVEHKLVAKINQLIHAQIRALHATHLSDGYALQRKAYDTFRSSVSNEGYLCHGDASLSSSGSHEILGSQSDPEQTEAAFRDSWDLSIQGLSVMAAEYFPGQDDLDRWFVSYQLQVSKLMFNVFVKYYPHRRPQVEIVYDEIKSF